MKQKTRIKRSIIITAIGLIFAVQTVWAGMEGWLNDFEEAKTQAAKTGRPILVNFSGSDWCGWCIRLDKEVLSKNAFKNYAKDNLVLFNADFPRSTKLPEMEAKQNAELAEQFEIQGFPTLLLLEADGKTVIAKTGYQKGGAENYVKHIKELLSDYQERKSGAQDTAK